MIQSSLIGLPGLLIPEVGLPSLGFRMFKFDDAGGRAAKVSEFGNKVPRNYFRPAENIQYDLGEKLKFAKL